MTTNQWLAILLVLNSQRNMEYAVNPVIRHLWTTGKMGHMHVAMKDAVASSLLLLTTLSGTSDATTLITVHLCVSLSAGDHGKSK